MALDRRCRILDNEPFLLLRLFVKCSNSGHSNYYGSTAGIAAENEKLKLVIAHKDELIANKEAMIAQKDALIAQQRSEIDTLKMLISARQSTDTE